MKRSSDWLVRGIATFFYVGYAPVAPGSVASAVAVGLCYVLRTMPVVYVGVFLLLTALGFAAAGRMETLTGQKDPSCVVIDEVSGIMISFFLLPFTPKVVLTAYFLFRAFDMFKITPADRLERIGGSAGIMLDDMAAGVYTNVVMHMALALVGAGSFG